MKENQKNDFEIKFISLKEACKLFSKNVDEMAIPKSLGTYMKSSFIKLNIGSKFIEQDKSYYHIE